MCVLDGNSRMKLARPAAATVFGEVANDRFHSLIVGGIDEEPPILFLHNQSCVVQFF